MFGIRRWVVILRRGCARSPTQIYVFRRRFYEFLPRLCDQERTESPYSCVNAGYCGWTRRSHGERNSPQRRYVSLLLNPIQFLIHKTGHLSLPLKRLRKSFHGSETASSWDYHYVSTIYHPWVITESCIGRNDEYLKHVVDHAITVVPAAMVLRNVPSFLRPFVIRLDSLTNKNYCAHVSRPTSGN